MSATEPVSPQALLAIYRKARLMRGLPRVAARVL
jgi:hypothetical protein